MKFLLKNTYWVYFNKKKSWVAAHTSALTNLVKVIDRSMQFENGQIFVVMNPYWICMMMAGPLTMGALSILIESFHVAEWAPPSLIYMASSL
jgi:hypothetical protein